TYTSLYGTSVWAKMLSSAGRVTRNCSRGATTTVVRVSVTTLSATWGLALAPPLPRRHHGELHRSCQEPRGAIFDTCDSASFAHPFKCKGSRHKWALWPPKRRQGNGRKAERRFRELGAIGGATCRRTVSHAASRCV